MNTPSAEPEKQPQGRFSPNTGTGRFNLARGAIGMIIAVAAAASTTIFGMIAQDMGRWAAFLGMALVAAAGGLVVWFLLGETRPERYMD